MNYLELNNTTLKFDRLNFEENKPLIIYGMIQNLRITKWGGFIILRTYKGLMQVVFENSVAIIRNSKGEKCDSGLLNREAAIKITGTVRKADIKDASLWLRDKEVVIDSVEILSTPDNKNLIDINAANFGNEANFAFKLDHRQVTLRNVRDSSIFKISGQISKAFVDFLNLNSFTQIFTPKIVSAGAEGGANIFEIQYFEKKAFLAQSPQFYKQIGVGVFERVFEIAPVYRAEKHNTSRHLNEYISVDVEMGFIKDHTDLMLLEAAMLRHVFQQIELNCKYELSILKATLPKLPDNVPVFRLSEVHEILHEHYADNLTADHRGEPDMAPEEEVLICDYTLKNFDSDFAFVTHFPTKHRAFYSMADPQDETLTLSFDLLMCGREITSGSQRLHLEADYIKKMKSLDMNPANFEFYLETFRSGMPPHGGFAIGLERLTAGILGIHNVKEASLFPRDVNRIAP